ncbi:MAG: RHS repeat domain-containing protein [Christensenellales bacterium]
MTGVVYGEETAPRYEYDYNAKGQVARVRDNLLNRTTQSEYDMANRPVRVKTSEDAKHVYTGQVAYDNVYGNLSEFTEKVGENRQEFGTKFGYDDENRPTSLTYSIGATTIGQSTTTIDKLNRTTFSAVKLGSKTFTSEYHFAAGGYGTGSVTNLVSSITQPGCNCGYGYDDNGNIASATLNGKWTGYTYDALGQLVQVNDHSDTRSGENGTTWKYTYDLGGNILKKERFVYNDTTNPLETVTYTYGDANWRDKLTAVNGNAIRYDAIGNPLSDGTWTYTWQNGRQLQKMQKSGVTAEFVYNADGLRVQKTVNGVATKYTLHGKNVVHMTSGTDELHFFYDAQNRPAVVVYNGTAYAYVKSLQGDIVALLNGAGNVVVSYVYDAWGAPIGKSGSMAETLGSVQPFRYRGYVFDEETGLYYLRSRYYNPGWGRFVNADVLIGAGKLLSHNLFAYCDNVPVSFSDKHGQTRENSFFYETTIEDVAGNCACQTIPEIIFRNYIGEWPSPETVNKKGKVHVIINYLDFCNDELVTVISDEDLLTLSRMLAYEIDKRYGINFDSIDIKQMKGEIALHMYGYIWFGLKNCYDIDLDIYCDGSVRDSRWRVNFAASLFKN